MPAGPQRFATQLCGSWCKPHWIADHDRVYGAEGSWWRVGHEFLGEALDDCTQLAITDQNAAGLTYQTDGEQRRQTFSGYFYALDGIDSQQQGPPAGHALDIGSYLTFKERPVAPADAPPMKHEQPRVTGPIGWSSPILADDLAFLKQFAGGQTKMTVIGPVTLALRLVDEHYGDLAEMTFAVADALNAEIRNLVALGVDLVQIDEPEVHFRHSTVADFAVEAIDRALHGVTCRTAVHMCYGYSKNIAEKRSTPVFEAAVALLAQSSVDALCLEYEQPAHQPDLLTHAGDKQVILGVLNLDTEAAVETVDHIVERATAAVDVVGPHRLDLAPDCGMWFLPRPHAAAKIAAMEQAAVRLRSKFS